MALTDPPPLVISRDDGVAHDKMNLEVQQTLVLIDGNIKDAVIDIIKTNGFSIIQSTDLATDKYEELCRENLATHSFQNSVYAVILEKHDAIQAWQELMTKTLHRQFDVHAIAGSESISHADRGIHLVFGEHESPERNHNTEEDFVTSPIVPTTPPAMDEGKSKKNKKKKKKKKKGSSAAASVAEPSSPTSPISASKPAGENADDMDDDLVDSPVSDKPSPLIDSIISEASDGNRADVNGSPCDESEVTIANVQNNTFEQKPFVTPTNVNKDVSAALDNRQALEETTAAPEAVVQDAHTVVTQTEPKLDSPQVELDERKVAVGSLNQVKEQGNRPIEEGASTDTSGKIDFDKTETETETVQEESIIVDTVVGQENKPADTIVKEEEVTVAKATVSENTTVKVEEVNIEETSHTKVNETGVTETVTETKEVETIMESKPVTSDLTESAMENWSSAIINVETVTGMTQSDAKSDTITVNDTKETSLIDLQLKAEESPDSRPSETVNEASKVETKTDMHTTAESKEIALINVEATTEESSAVQQATSDRINEQEVRTTSEVKEEEVVATDIKVGSSEQIVQEACNETALAEVTVKSSEKEICAADAKKEAAEHITEVSAKEKNEPASPPSSIEDKTAVVADKETLIQSTPAKSVKNAVKSLAKAFEVDTPQQSNAPKAPVLNRIANKDLWSKKSVFDTREERTSCTVTASAGTDGMLEATSLSEDAGTPTPPANEKAEAKVDAEDITVVETSTEKVTVEAKESTKVHQDKKSKVEDIKSKVEDIKPKVENIKPKVDDIKPKVQDTKPKADTAAPLSKRNNATVPPIAKTGTSPPVSTAHAKTGSHETKVKNLATASEAKDLKPAVKKTRAEAKEPIVRGTKTSAARTGEKPTATTDTKPVRTRPAVSSATDSKFAFTKPRQTEASRLRLNALADAKAKENAPRTRTSVMGDKPAVSTDKTKRDNGTDQKARGSVRIPRVALLAKTPKTTKESETTTTDDNEKSRKRLSRSTFSRLTAQTVASSNRQSAVSTQHAEVILSSPARNSRVPTVASSKQDKAPIATGAQAVKRTTVRKSPGDTTPEKRPSPTSTAKTLTGAARTGAPISSDNKAKDSTPVVDSTPVAETTVGDNLPESNGKLIEEDKTQTNGTQAAELIPEHEEENTEDLTENQPPQVETNGNSPSDTLEKEQPTVKSVVDSIPSSVRRLVNRFTD